MAAARSPALYPPSLKQSAAEIRKEFLDIAALQEQELQYNQWVSLKSLDGSVSKSIVWAHGIRYPVPIY